LSGNAFSGRIPSTIGSLLNLRVLDFSGLKNLSGNLPSELFGLPQLQHVSLADNLFSGDVPEGFSSLWSLRHLNISVNSFSGSIPATYGYMASLQVLSASHNRISGEVPAELANCSNLTVLHLSDNHLTGPVPSDLSRLGELEELDLSHNQLSGKIPPEISNCSSLATLKLDDNHLGGEIPASLANLSKLQTLDLSSNNITGGIPVPLAQIPGLVSFNVSHNDLTGEIPAVLGSRFGTPSAFASNPDLCGPPLESECSQYRQHRKRQRLQRLALVIGAVAAASLLLVLLCCCCVFGLLRWRRKFVERRDGVKKRRRSPGRGSGSSGTSTDSQTKLIMFNSRITYADTVEATRQFDEENVLSRGRHGLMFKACYSEGTVLAILRLPSTSADGAVVVEEGSFRKEAENLGRVKHRNLTVLRGYYAGPPPDVRLLVYDYMPNGNLATLLQEASHQDGHILNWPMRHLIALGVSRGLAFLHQSGVIHGDVKPQNILFDADFEPHLSDFGLEPMVVTAGAAAAAAAASTSATTPVGSLGYVAPDAATAGQATREGDVYSFGIVLLELLTGRRPGMFAGEDEDIVKWVKRQLQRGAVTELLEPGLLELDPESSEWEEFLLGIKVGLLCTASDPLDRPAMGDVVFMLEGCRVGPDIPSSADPTTQASPA
jgi:hypothetical protein